MKIMSVFISIIFLLNVLSVLSDVQCDCNSLRFLKQLLQQEIFERKRADSLLRSEPQKFSTEPRSESSSIQGPDISTRVDQLEQLVVVLKNTLDVGQQEGSANRGQREENLLFQTIVKEAFKTEKLERMNFISHVQKQMEQFSDFKDSLEVFTKERIMQITNDLETFEDNMGQFEQNSRQNIKNSRDTLINELEEFMLHIKTDVNELFDYVTDLREDLMKSSTAMDSLKAEVNNLGTNVRSSEEFVSELTSQFEEHQNTADKFFTVVTNKIGICRGAMGNENEQERNWKWHGNKWYLFIKTGVTNRETWFSALERCRELNATLVEVESREENNYITDNIKENEDDRFWIGLTDHEEEGAWKWNSAKSTLKAGEFRNWEPNEPNNEKGDEDCANIYATGRWNDLPCADRSIGFICQKSPEL